MLQSLLRTAIEADKQLGGTFVENIADVLQRVFADATCDRNMDPQQSKKQVALFIVTELLRCYFAMNKLVFARILCVLLMVASCLHWRIRCDYIPVLCRATGGVGSSSVDKSCFPRQRTCKVRGLLWSTAAYDTERILKYVPVGSPERPASEPSLLQRYELIHAFLFWQKKTHSRKQQWRNKMCKFASDCAHKRGGGQWKTLISYHTD